MTNASKSVAPERTALTDILTDHGAVHALADVIAKELLASPGFIAALDRQLTARRNAVEAFNNLAVEVVNEDSEHAIYCAVFQPGEVPAGVPRYTVYIRDENDQYHPVLDGAALHPGVVPALDAVADSQTRPNIVYINLINTPVKE